MKIGDHVYVHGIVDEIRKDTVIIRNEGGYFGTVASEIITGGGLTALYVRDKSTGIIRMVGDDMHDMLTIRDGKLYYHNLQNGDGCSLGGPDIGGYEFVENVDDHGYNCDPRENEK